MQASEQAVGEGFWQKTLLPIGVFLTCLFGTLLRFWDLNRLSLWQDEIHTVIYVNDHPSLWTVVYRVATWDLHSPLYYVLLRIQVWIQQLFSIPLTDGNLRILSAVLGTLALPALFLLLRRIFKNSYYALFGLFLAAINMYSIYYSQELRMYALILLLAPLVLYFRLNLWDEEGQELKRGMAVGYVVASICLLYSSLVGLFFVFGTWLSVFVFSWMERRQYPKRWQDILKLGIIIFICYLPWLGVMWRQSMFLKGGVGTGMVINNPRELFKFVFESLMFGSRKIDPGYGIINKIIRVLMLFSLLNLLDRERRKEHAWILLSFAFTFIVYYLITFHRQFHTSRYFSTWWPFAMYFLVAAFSGLAALLKKYRPSWQWSVVVLAILFTGFYSYVQNNQIRDYFTDFAKEDWRGIVAYLNSHQQSGEALLVIGGWEKGTLSYYGVKLPMVTVSELVAGKAPGFYHRFIYLGAYPPKEETKNELLPDFKQEAWPLNKNHYIWTR